MPAINVPGSPEPRSNFQKQTEIFSQKKFQVTYLKENYMKQQGLKISIIALFTIGIFGSNKTSKANICSLFLGFNPQTLFLNSDILYKGAPKFLNLTNAVFFSLASETSITNSFGKSVTSSLSKKTSSLDKNQ